MGCAGRWNGAIGADTVIDEICPAGDFSGIQRNPPRMKIGEKAHRQHKGPRPLRPRGSAATTGEPSGDLVQPTEAIDLRVTLHAAQRAGGVEAEAAHEVCGGHQEGDSLRVCSRLIS